MRQLTNESFYMASPAFQDGYNEWRKDCGGVYTIAVAEAIAVGEETFRKNLGCPSADR